MGDYGGCNHGFDETSFMSFQCYTRCLCTWKMWLFKSVLPVNYSRKGNVEYERVKHIGYYSLPIPYRQKESSNSKSSTIDGFQILCYGHPKVVGKQISFPEATILVRIKLCMVSSIYLIITHLLLIQALLPLPHASSALFSQLIIARKFGLRYCPSKTF